MGKERPNYANQRRGKENESAAIFFLRCVTTTCRAVDRSHRQFLSQPHFDFAGLDSGHYSRLPRRQ